MLRSFVFFILMPMSGMPDTTYRLPELHNAPTVEGRILGASLRHGVDPELSLRLAWRESNLSNDVVGDNGWSKDHGVFQLNDAAISGAADMNEEENIETGVSILAMWLRECGGNQSCAVRAYGVGHIEKLP